MKLTHKLLNYLHRFISADPMQFLALRIAYDGTLQWSVEDKVLTLSASGGSGQSHVIDLTGYTVSGLGTYIAGLPGYSVPYADAGENGALSALVLLDGGADLASPKGDYLYGYTSLLFAFLEPIAAQLREAKQQIVQALLQLSTKTAGGEWLDEWGAYCGVARDLGESDGVYGPRICATILRPLGNNVAIESALRVINGGLSASVMDFDEITNNSYGLFDVNFSVSLAMLADLSPAQWSAKITAVVDGMRDAGTFLRNISIITPVQATVNIGAAVTSGSTVWIYPK